MNEFKPGDHVRYIPNHAHGDKHHPDCEDGIVTSTTDLYVFVRYGRKVTSKATNADDLVKLR